MKKSKKTAKESKASYLVEGEVIGNAEYPDVITVRTVQVLQGFRVRMTFSNNETRELDLETYLDGPVFEAIRRDPKMFRQVFVDAETETLTWANGTDIAPDTLYEDSVKVENLVTRSTTPKAKTGAVSTRTAKARRTVKAKLTPRKRERKPTRAAARNQ